MSITVELQGGVGNQLFQIATAYSVSRDLNLSLKFVKDQFSGCRQGAHPSKYYKSLYQKLDFVDELKIDKTFFEEQWTFYPLVEKVREEMKSEISCLSLNGYFQSDKYFKKYKDEIKELFIPSGGILSYLRTNSEVFSVFPELQENHEYVFIGVRRGDYIAYAHFHNPCGMDYYNKAMDKMNGERYYVFSDDIDWCKQNFIGEKFRFIEIGDELDQLLISSLFGKYIISNSSFNWWGSFFSLYDNPRIIAPDKWIFGPNVRKEQYDTIYRENMEIVERKIEV